MPGTAILLDRLTLAPGGEMPLTVAAGSVAWLQVLRGQAELIHDESREMLTEAHVAFLPPGFAAGLRTQSGSAVL